MATLDDDLLGIVNKLQDLVFNTIGNDSLDLPQIVRLKTPSFLGMWMLTEFGSPRLSLVLSRQANPLC